jgi:hypothetical protein
MARAKRVSRRSLERTRDAREEQAITAGAPHET